MAQSLSLTGWTTPPGAPRGAASAIVAPMTGCLTDRQGSRAALTP
ncbi:hypothetical protein [Streptomyces sioyaensis]|nr:hypothetical protein [Streptomyces sioyaensis]